MKRCSECKEWKSKSEFHKDKSRKDGLCNRCKQCKTEYNQEYYQKNRKQLIKQMSKYNEIHKDEKIEYDKQYNQKNKKRRNKQYKQWYKKHKKQKTEYTKAHKEEIRKNNSHRRGFGYNPLNEWKEGFVTHHINDIDVIFIPQKIHEKFRSKGHTLEYHRDKILKYYGSIERMVNNNPIQGGVNE